MIDRKRRASFLVSIILLLFYLTAHGGLEKLHPYLRMVLDGSDTTIATTCTIADGSMERCTSTTAGEDRLGVLVKTSDANAKDALEGFAIRSTTGTIHSIWVDGDGLAALASNESVIYIEPSWKLRPHLDLSVPAIAADVARETNPPVTGSGVIVGVVDTGADYTHLDFRFDGTGDGFEESSRMLAILDQTLSTAGVEYTRDDIESDLANGYGANEGIVRHTDTDGHGTHVMSIAAGDGSSSLDGFCGVAPDAWLVMVKTTFYSADILSGVKYIFDLADAMHLPAVVNLSLGGHHGPHDGTSLFEQGLTELAHGSGRIVVVSAGNEGNLPIHMSDTLDGDESSFQLVMTEWDTTLILWYPGSSQVSVTVFPPEGEAIIAPFGTDSGWVVTPGGRVRIDNAAFGANPNNGDHEVSIRVTGVQSSDPWDVTVENTGTGTGGTYHAWVVQETSRIVGGDSTHTIAEPGNAEGAITVGSFNTKAAWKSASGKEDHSAQYPLGTISSFSSRGPTRDGRQKPEIAAPGAWIGAALSTDAVWRSYWVASDGVHGMQLGTSMAAAHVSGAVALLLSVDPHLTHHQVVALLTDSASRDAFTGAIPNDRWGWGRLNVAAALSMIGVSPAPPYVPVVNRPRIWLDENPVSSLARFVLDLPSGVQWAVLRIYNAAGHRLFEADVQPSGEQFEWSLNSSRGDHLTSGLYLYVLVTNVGVSDVGRLVIAR